jgi:hypothetical protein
VRLTGGHLVSATVGDGAPLRVRAMLSLSRTGSDEVYAVQEHHTHTPLVVGSTAPGAGIAGVETPGPGLDASFDRNFVAAGRLATT